MANVNIKFNGKEFLLSCEDGQEEHLEELSLHLNEKFNSLKSTLGNIGENKLLLISSITVIIWSPDIFILSILGECLTDKSHFFSPNSSLIFSILIFAPISITALIKPFLYLL